MTAEALARIDAAAQALAATWPPLTQQQASQADSLIALHWPAILAARARQPQAA